jgi:hypothetical protein
MGGAWIEYRLAAILAWYGTRCMLRARERNILHQERNEASVALIVQCSKYKKIIKIFFSLDHYFLFLIINLFLNYKNICIAIHLCFVCV